MRNAVKRVTHKERAQPNDRKKYGLLEKHKDYKERSNDYHNKQAYLKNMKMKALEKNPDEFYFEMHNSELKQGKHRQKKDTSMDDATIALLKTQDLGYISMKKSIDDSKIRRIQDNVHLIGQKRVKSHKIFLDDDAQITNFDPESHFDTPNELMDRAFNRPKRSTIMALANSDPSTVSDLKMPVHSSRSSNAELQQRSKRSARLKTALLQLSLQRSLSGKGAKRKIKVSNQTDIHFENDSVVSPLLNRGQDEEDKAAANVVAVYKWKRQRSR